MVLLVTASVYVFGRTCGAHTFYGLEVFLEHEAFAIVIRAGMSLLVGARACEVFAMIIGITASLPVILDGACGILAMVTLEVWLGGPALTAFACVWLRAEVLLAVTETCATSWAINF